MLIKKGNKKAKIDFGGLTVKEIISALKEKEKKKSIPKVKYDTLKSVHESEDKKNIIFEFNNGNSFRFHLPNSKIYDTTSNKLITLTDFCYLTKMSQHGITSIIDLSKEPWVWAFFTILKDVFNKDNYITYSILYEHSKEDYMAAEQLAKQEFFQEWLKSEIKVDVLQKISENLMYDDKKFNFKEFKNRYFWFIENCEKQEFTGSCDLAEMYDIYKIAIKNNLKDAFEYAFDNYAYTLCNGYIGIKQFIQLVKMGDYEPQRLIDYLCRDLPNQGLSLIDEQSFETLFDYVRMNVQMKNDFEKFPRYLRTYHDVTLKNYELAKNARFKRKFASVVRSLKKYEYSNKTHSVISPKSVDDLTNEGTKLSHCVASYAEDVAEKETVIMFIRKKDFLNIPLVTIEINKNKVVQAKGKNNSNPQPEEKKFLDEYKKYLESI